MGGQSDRLNRELLSLLIPTLKRSTYNSVLSISVFLALLGMHAPVGAGVWLGLRIAVSTFVLSRLRSLSAETTGTSVTARLTQLTNVMLLSGVVWGLIPVFVQPDRPQWRAVVALWIFGHQAVTTVTCCAYRPLAIKATVGSTIVAAAGLGLEGDGFGLVLAALVLLGGLYSILQANGLRTLVVEGLKSRLELSTLTESLHRRQIELERSNVRLNRLAGTDELTSIPNRRSFYETVAPRGTTTRAGWIGLIDIDHFKQINDSHGHAVGDEILRGLSDRWASLLVDGTLGRLGGDEFAFVLFESSAAAAEQLVDRLVTISDTIIRVDHVDVFTSISLGVAPFNAGDPFATVLDNADTALYQAKSDGRNQAAFFATAELAEEGPESPPPVPTEIDPFVDLRERLVRNGFLTNRPLGEFSDQLGKVVPVTANRGDSMATNLT